MKITTTPLCKIAFKYGTDKCPEISNSYTPFYYELLKDRRTSIKKVLEVGIGSKKTMKYPKHYTTGASLRMWRDYLPNAQIYGADILPETMFMDERIETFLCDQTSKVDLENLIQKTGSDIDLFIDDGLHTRRSQIFLCKVIMPILKKNVIYIIEDVGFPRTIVEALSEYDCFVPRFTDKPGQPKNRIIVVSKP